MRTRSRLLVLPLLLAGAIPADALFVLTADNVCDPADDPCVVDQPYESSMGLPLDFGLRTVVVTGDGSFTGGLDLSCGALVVETPGTWLRVTEDVSEPPVRIVARKGCSAAPQTPCLNNADCLQGTCSAGDGGMRIGGSIDAPSRWIELKAAGDVIVSGRLRGAADLPGAAGGLLTVTSTGGSITLTGRVNVASSRHPNVHGSPYAGGVGLVAATDVVMRGTIRANGGDGEVRATAGRDLRVESAVLLRARGAARKGGDVVFTAGRDLLVKSDVERRPAKIDLKGGTTWHLAGDAGAGYLTAGGRIEIGSGTLLRSDCGRGFVSSEDVAFPGNWTLEAEGNVAIDGTISARGCRGLNPAATVEVWTYGSFVLGANGKLDLRGAYGAELRLELRSRAPAVLDGVVDLTGLIIDEPNPDNAYGAGGRLDISGGDVSLSGTVRSGGDSDGGLILVDACRVHLGRSSLIDNSLGLQVGNWSNTTNLFYVGESMTAEPGSAILAAATGGTEIIYRDANKPPSLLGAVEPPPILTPAPGLTGCPVCGNDEIDEGEQCDDGNTTAGDGCDGDCQAE